MFCRTGYCTFCHTGKKHSPQPWRQCKTCKLVGNQVSAFRVCFSLNALCHVRRAVVWRARRLVTLVMSLARSASQTSSVTAARAVCFCAGVFFVPSLALQALRFASYCPIVECSRIKLALTGTRACLLSAVAYRNCGCRRWFAKS